MELLFDGASLPSGWTLVVIETTKAHPGLRPVLYAWSKASEERPVAYTLPAMSGREAIRILLPFPADVTRLRLDPTYAARVSFKLASVKLAPEKSVDGQIFSEAPSAWVGEPDTRPPAAKDQNSAFEVVPVQDLVSTENGQLKTLGGASRLDLRVPGATLPTGLITLTIKVLASSEVLHPVLHVDGNGPALAIELPVVAGGNIIKVTIKFPQVVTSLQLSPTDKVGVDFEFGSISFARPSLTGPLFELTACPNSNRGADPKFSALSLMPLAGLDHVGGDRYKATAKHQLFRLRPVEGDMPPGMVYLRLALPANALPLSPILSVLDGQTGSSLNDVRLPHLQPNRLVDVLANLGSKVQNLGIKLSAEPNTIVTAPQIEFCNPESLETNIYLPLSASKKPTDRRSSYVPFVATPVNHLVSLANGKYRSTGGDPQFSLTTANSAMPRGWTLFHFEVDSPNDVLNPILYIWSGGQFMEMPLPFDVGQTEHELLIRLPDKVTALRFDPAEKTDVEVSLRKISFAGIDAMESRVFIPIDADRRQMDYRRWVFLYGGLSSSDLVWISEDIECLGVRPRFSVVMPVYNPEPGYLRLALQSVRDQLYPDWELCIADDCSTDPAIRPILEEFARDDSRIKLVFRSVNGHISASTNSALELVTGEFVVLMDHDDLLAPHALYMAAVEINADPRVDIIYTDEDKVDGDGRRHDPHFKSDWNLDLFHAQNFVAHLGIYRTELAKAAGGFRVGFEGSQDYDFTLRVLRLTSRERIRHIPHVLYHWRIFTGVRTFSSNNPQRSIDTARRALVDHFEALGEAVEVQGIESFPSWWRIRRHLPDPAPAVTLIVPTRDRVRLLKACMDGLLYKTDYPNLDIIIIDNGSVEPATLSYFETLKPLANVTVLRLDEPFNYSRLNNKAARIARGQFVGFINNDIEVIQPDWLAEMVMQAGRPGVGAVGAKLRYGSDTLQHAGVVLGTYGVAAHGHRHFAHDAVGYFGRPQLHQEMSAVTAAAMIVPKDLFLSLGGFDEEHLVVSYNDVDLCLRIREAGRQVVYTPFAELYHMESASRGADTSPVQKELQRVERGYMIARWGPLLQADPYYNPNLSLASEDYQLAFPPRAVKPWLMRANAVNRLALDAQATLDRDHRLDPAVLASIAAATTIVIATPAPYAMLDVISAGWSDGDGRRIAGPLSGSGVRPAGIVLVDSLAHRDRIFVSDAASLRFRKAHPDVPLTVVVDDGRDYTAARTANLGVSAAGHADYLVVITSDCTLTPYWLPAIIKAQQALGPRSVVAPHMLLADGRVERPVSHLMPEFEQVLALSDKHKAFAALPQPQFEPAGALADDQPVRSATLLPAGVMFGPTASLGSAPFDARYLSPLLMEDFSIRRRQAGTELGITTAVLATMPAERPRDLAHAWKYMHDYAALNRQSHGDRQADVIEFICPFHRGDVLIGLQIAHAAHEAGKRIRFHVAESIMNWVADFAPAFPVKPVPVPVPPASRTGLVLTEAYAHVVTQPDASPTIARSHPERGLDETALNLAESMLLSVGLPLDTRFHGLMPRPDASQEAEALAAIAPYGDRVILLHRSGGWSLKTIPDPVLADLQAIVRRHGYKLVQIGGPGDAQVPGCDGAITRNFSPAHWSVIFRKASALVGVDSWSAHMAAILDIPHIQLYGSTQARHVNTRRFFKNQSAPGLILDTIADCSPCNSLTCLIAPVDYCMGYNINKIQIEEFLQKIQT